MSPSTSATKSPSAGAKSPSAGAKSSNAGATSPSTAALHQNLVHISRALRAIAGVGGLTAGSSSALWTIVNHSPIRLSDLADRESVAAPTMSRVVASLESAGFVERAVDPDDGRARLFRATDTGIELMRTAGSNRARALAGAIEGLDAADQARIHDGVQLLAQALTTDSTDSSSSHTAKATS